MIPPRSSSHAELTTFLVDTAPLVTASLARAYPGFGCGAWDDAVADALAAYVARPEPWVRVWHLAGAPATRRFLRVVAWRNLRAVHRGRRRREVGFRVESPRTLGEPEVRVLVREVLETGVERALDACGARDREGVRHALLDLLEGGEPETVVAARHGVRREYLNRARRALTAEITDTLSAGGRL